MVMEFHVALFQPRAGGEQGKNMEEPLSSHELIVADVNHCYTALLCLADLWQKRRKQPFGGSLKSCFRLNSEKLHPPKSVAPGALQDTLLSFLLRFQICRKTKTPVTPVWSEGRGCQCQDRCQTVLANRFKRRSVGRRSHRWRAEQ